jgi:hypothetical protein
VFLLRLKSGIRFIERKKPPVSGTGGFVLAAVSSSRAYVAPGVRRRRRRRPKRRTAPGLDWPIKPEAFSRLGTGALLPREVIREGG